MTGGYLKLRANVASLVVKHSCYTHASFHISGLDTRQKDRQTDSLSLSLSQTEDINMLWTCNVSAGFSVSAGSATLGFEQLTHLWYSSCLLCSGDVSKQRHSVYSRRIPVAEAKKPDYRDVASAHLSTQIATARVEEQNRTPNLLMVKTR